MRVCWPLLLVLLHACGSTPVHKKGESMGSVRLLYGMPIVGKAIAWDGGGDAETVSAGFYNHWFVSNRFSMGVGFTATYFDQEGGGVLGAELQAAGRWHFAEWGNRSIFWDLNGGWMQTSDAVPPEGTEWNMTFAFGPGIEIPLDDQLKLLTGVEFHHLSNALGRFTSDNPSQNEVRLWVGLGWLW